MAYNRPDAATAFFDEDRFAPQHSKGPDPLSANWSYDSAIDLFSLNTMLPETFPMDVPNDMLLDPKDFPVDLFAPPADISGFAISHSGEDSVSDLESDDQLWSPAYRVSSLDSAADVQPVSPRTVEKSTRRRTTTTNTTTQKPREVPRWSSSPEITPQEYSVPAQMISPTAAPAPASPAPSSRKNSRSMSTDSQTASGRNAAKRAAHNIIEKRYRTNMNAKFVALEKAMSSSGVQKPTKGGSSASLKKSEILTNAIAYMQELQDENAALQKELALMKQNLLPGGMWRHPKDETFRS